MKILKIVVIILTALVGGCFVANLYGWHRMKTGYEVKAKDHASYLQERLADDLGYSGFDPKWLQKAWVNGFREHTNLYLVSNSQDLESAIKKVATRDAATFQKGGYVGPSTAPNWWNVAKIDAAETWYFRKNYRRSWRFTWIDGRLYIVLKD